MEANSSQKNHAMIVSIPLQGHINPFVQLALKLASRGFTVTFLVFEHIHQEITQAQSATQPGTATETETGDIFEGARTGPNPLDISYRVISDGLPLEFDRTGRVDEYVDWCLYGGWYDKLEAEVGEIVMGSKPPRPHVWVADTFYPWTSKIAKKFGLFHASFWTEPALVFNLYYHVHLLREMPTLIALVTLAAQLICWTCQFIGHGVFEKRAPALLDNLVQAFLMAPFFVLLEALQQFFGYEPYPGFHAKVKAMVDAEIKEWQEKKQKKSS